MLKRWSKLFLAFWIVLVQAMAPFVHAHVGGRDGGDQPASHGIHIHIAPGYNKSSPPERHDLAVTAVSSGDAAMAVGVSQGIAEGLAKIPHGKGKSSPVDDAVSVPSLRLPDTIATECRIAAFLLFPFIDHRISPCAARAPPAV